MKMKKILLALALTAVTTMNSEGAVSSSHRFTEVEKAVMERGILESQDRFFGEMLETQTRIQAAFNKIKSNPDAIRALVIGITGAGKVHL